MQQLGSGLRAARPQPGGRDGEGWRGMEASPHRPFTRPLPPRSHTQPRNPLYN